jgi:hypothetical protein
VDAESEVAATFGCVVEVLLQLVPVSPTKALVTISVLSRGGSVSSVLIIFVTSLVFRMVWSALEALIVVFLLLAILVRVIKELLGAASSFSRLQVCVALCNSSFFVLFLLLVWVVFVSLLLMLLLLLSSFMLGSRSTLLLLLLLLLLEPHAVRWRFLPTFFFL